MTWHGLTHSDLTPWHSLVIGIIWKIDHYISKKNQNLKNKRWSCECTLAVDGWQGSIQLFVLFQFEKRTGRQLCSNCLLSQAMNMHNCNFFWIYNQVFLHHKYIQTNFYFHFPTDQISLNWCYWFTKINHKMWFKTWKRVYFISPILYPQVKKWLILKLLKYIYSYLTP